MNDSLKIRKATEQDCGDIWIIIRQVIETGDTYVFDPRSDKKKMLDYWCGKDKYTYVAELKGEICGTFIIKDNMPDLGSHVANASYMTLKKAAGQGIGCAMGEFSLKEAKKLGYKAMQFNIVVKTNERAVRLWKKLGFKIIGEIPDAFKHIQNGYTNALIMWKDL